MKGDRGMKDVTKEIEKIINKLEKEGKANDYTLQADAESIEKLQYILKSIFKK